MSNKRLKSEFPRALQRMPSSARYPKNASPVPWRPYNVVVKDWRAISFLNQQLTFSHWDSLIYGKQSCMGIQIDSSYCKFCWLPLKSGFRATSVSARRMALSKFLRYKWVSNPLHLESLIQQRKSVLCIPIFLYGRCCQCLGRAFLARMFILFICFSRNRNGCGSRAASGWYSSVSCIY